MTQKKYIKNDPYKDTLDRVISLKPFPGIRRLQEALLPAAKKISDRRYCRFNPGTAEVYLLTEGYFSLHRELDDLQLCIAKAPHIFGFSELLHPCTSATYVNFSTDYEAYSITGEQTEKILSEKPYLWKDVAILLAFHLQFASWRDLHLLNDRAYVNIRGKLLELASQPAALRNDNSVLGYILSSTRLSRSTVMRVLKDLADGGYIEIVKGRLVSIKHLPLRY